MLIFGSKVFTGEGKFLQVSSIITRKINNTIYVIEITSYRDKNGKPRNKQRCLGQLDEDGVLISSRKLLPSTIKEVRTVTTKLRVDKIK